MTIAGFVILAALGSTMRWGSVLIAGQHGTTLVNIAGAFALGALASDGSELATTISIAGIGALSTVSGWVHEVEALWSAGRRWSSVVHVAASLFGGVIAAWAALQL